MARPTLHHTVVKRQIAAREKRCRYYENWVLNGYRHCERINLKRHQLTSSSSSTLSECLALVKTTKDETVQFVKTLSAPDTTVETTGRSDITIIEKAIEKLEDFSDNAHRGLDWIYERCGICDEWHAVDESMSILAILNATKIQLKDGTPYMADPRTTSLHRDVPQRVPQMQKKGNYANFWLPFFEKWEEKWPTRDSLFPDASLDQLTDAQLEKEAEARKRLTAKLRNDLGNLKAGRKANASGNSVVHKLISKIIKASPTSRTRHLKPEEVYAKKYYASRVQPGVKAELSSLQEELNPPNDRKNRNLTNESAKVKEEISQLARDMKEARGLEDEKDHSPEVTDAQLLTEILSTFFSKLHDTTGWTFSVLLGGPNPANGGKLDISSLHIGSTTLGNPFNQVFPKFDENVMVPYFEFVSRAFSDAGTDNVSNETSSQSILEDDTLLRISAAPDDIPGTDPENKMQVFLEISLLVLKMMVSTTSSIPPSLPCQMGTPPPALRLTSSLQMGTPPPALHLMSSLQRLRLWLFLQ
ncbi:uncharacterized protein F5147DRAFT_653553 [Suillus discolor]|uniref:Uncharacterized protein n=1 Tax=Suillus discolor TaxID=1912936 RepID=A0A9P7F6K4_9AGAM|nr:uncharacterized protein F5147DRAFT_653553 [Suillus discolor]KAG2106955.1 hypothetical protein F5147DRAFT_653553 [Suillus discolor]